MSRESKALTDRYMLEFCDSPFTEKEIKRYFSDRPFYGVDNNAYMSIDNNVFYVYVDGHESYVELIPVRFIDRYTMMSMYYAPETYHAIFSKRRACMKNNPNYANNQTYKIWNRLLQSDGWMIYTIFLFFLFPEYSKTIDNLRRKQYPLGEPLGVLNEGMLKYIKIKYGGHIQ